MTNEIRKLLYLLNKEREIIRRKRDKLEKGIDSNEWNLLHGKIDGLTTAIVETELIFILNDGQRVTDILTTDLLVEKIISMGLKLPVYDYNYGSYMADCPKNEKLNDGSVIAIDEVHIFDTFREACEWIVRNAQTQK